MRHLAIIFTFFLSLSALADNEDVFNGECGLSHKFNGFEFVYAGYNFSMPKSGLLIRESIKIHENKKLHDWWTLSSGAEVHKTEDYLIVRIWDTDCVDLSSSQIFVLSNKGQLLLEETERTQHWPSGYFYNRGYLAYWSEWFCYDSLQNSKPAYIYQLNESKTAFEQRLVEHKEFCSESFKSKFEKSKIKFEALPENAYSKRINTDGDLAPL